VVTISATAPDQPASTETSRFVRWAIALFFVTIFIPGSFYLAGVRMTPYRFFLLVMAIPMALRFRADPLMRVGLVDVLMLLATGWRALALLANHGMGEIFNAGSTFMELFCAYLFGRVYLRGPADFRFFFVCFLVTLAAFLPFALVELLASKELLRQIFGMVLEQQATTMRSQDFRLGMMRVQLSFDHAVLFGTFCTMAFANVYYVFRDRFPLNLAFMGFVGLMCLTALSSSSILVMGLQVALMGYAAAFRWLPYRWAVLGATALFLWYGFEIVFSKSIVDFIVQDLVFSTVGAETRVEQVVYGLKEIRRHPFFGVGLNDIRLPFWHGGVIDNFWLATTIRYGIPSLLFIVLAFVAQFLLVGAAKDLDETETRYRLGYMITFATTMLIIGAMSIWGIALVFVMAYVGAGGWFYDRRPDLSGLRLHERTTLRAQRLRGDRAA